jgi:hypothetical protein
MSVPPEETGEPKDSSSAEVPLDFDPYRFGAPEHPVPPEYAPPGYVPPPSTTPPTPPQGTPYGNVAPPAYPPPGYSASPPSYPEQGNPQGHPPQGYPQQGYPPPGYPQQGYPQGYPPPGYPQQGYPQGYPPVAPQYSSQYPQPRTGNGRAIAALILGIVSILLCWTTIIDIVPVALALTFGSIGRRQAVREPHVGGKGLATAGIICAAVGAVLAITVTVFATRAVSHCNQYTSGSTQFSDCVQHYFHLK